MRAFLSCALLAVSHAFAPPSLGAEVSRSSLGIEIAHVEDADGQLTSSNVVGLFEARQRIGKNGDLLLSLEGKKGLDSPAFDAFDVRELLYKARWGTVRFEAGVGRIFWGVTESRHLVNIVNQTDLRFDSSGATLLGQPLASVGADFAGAAWRLVVMPCHRPRAFQAEPGGEQEPALVDTNCERLDVAIRSHISKGPLDLGIVYFDGRTRDPAISEEPQSYPALQRWSVDAQLTLGAWLLKLEAVRNSQAQWRPRDASVVGFEYAFASLASRLELSVLYEHLEETGCSAFTCGDVLGVRIAANDTAGSQVLLTGLKDRHDGRTGYFIRGQRRLTDQVVIRVDVQKSGDTSQVMLAVSRSF